jgi:hypothetical protein
MVSDGGGSVTLAFGSVVVGHKKEAQTDCLVDGSFYF